MKLNELFIGLKERCLDATSGCQDGSKSFILFSKNQKAGNIIVGWLNFIEWPGDIDNGVHFSEFY